MGESNYQSEKKCSAFTMGRKKIKIKKERQGRTLIKDTAWMQENTQKSPPIPTPAIRVTVLLCGTEQYVHYTNL